MKRVAWIVAAAVAALVVAGLLGVGPAAPWVGGVTRPTEEGPANDPLSLDPAESGARLEGRGGATAGRPSPETVVPSVPAEVAGSDEKGGTIRGRVVRGAGGPPVDGARVLLRRPDSMRSYLRVSSTGRYDLLEARTGADGRFAFRGLLPAKDYVVRASAAPGAWTSLEGIDLRGRLTKDVGDVSLGGGGAIEGRVLDASGAPVADVRVAASWPVENELQIVLADPDTLEAIERETRSGADGKFLLEGLEPGEKVLVVTSPSAGSDVVFDVKVENARTTPAGDVRLPAAGALAGRILWDDDTPVADARVFAAVMGNRVVRTVAAGPDGAFRIEHLPAARYRLGVMVPGIPVRVTQEEHAAGEEDVVVRFAKTGSIEGRVVRSGTGDPVKRFTVRVEDEAGDMVEKFVRRLVAKTAGGEGFQDAEGRFRIPHVFPGEVRLVVSAEGFPDTPSASVEVSAGETSGPVRVEMPDGHGVHGVVRLPNGEPAAGAEVFATPVIEEGVIEEVDEFSFERASDSVADAEGKFLLPPQSPRAYMLVARVTDRPAAQTRVDLTRPVEQELVLQIPPSGTIEGTVVDDGGRPAPKVEIALISPDGGYRTANADAEGRFRATAVTPGPIVVRWESIREAPSNEERNAGREYYERVRRNGGEVTVSPDVTTRVSVRMPPLIRWTGRVHYANLPEGARPARGVWLYCPGHGGTWIPADDQGRFEARVEPGAYVAYVDDGKGNWSSSPLDVPPGTEFRADVER